jgi:hypothetical protein
MVFDLGSESKSYFGRILGSHLTPI